MSDLARVREISNLQRAWRWVKSNPDAAYKRYCRGLYTAYAVAEERSLIDLRERLRRGTYTPTHATKIAFPKPSGILRPYSILSIEDQIVYQAFVNVVADKLLPRVRYRYLKEIFGHLYAGKRSAFFYRKWSTGYTALNETCRKAFDRGFVYGASFDLTACYDSLDHGVLRHFLSHIGCDVEFTDRLSELLCYWTATKHRIYHDHGIPQGPLSSGLLAEVVLKHFDDHRGASREVKYVRYVDDIRLFAKTPLALRRMLVRLDILSKDVGLFPQSSKVHIHRITNIEEELKSISNPPEEVLVPNTLNQAKLRKRITALTPRFRILDSTRFKYLLACAKPNTKLNERLWRILESHPDLYGSILRYFQRYARFPESVALRLLKLIADEPLYHAIHADLIRTADSRLSPKYRSRFRRLVKRQWHPSLESPELTAALGRVAVRDGLLTYSQTRYAVLNSPEWWVRTELVNSLTSHMIGKPSLESIANTLIRDDTIDDVCMMSAMCIERHDLSVRSPSRDVKRRAGHILREFGRMRRLTADVCGVDQMFVHLLGQTAGGTKWRQFFGPQYRRAERQAVSCRALVDTNVTAWVPALDVLNDLLLSSLFRQRTSLGTHTLGNFGSLYKSAPFKADFPQTWKMVKTIHDKRLESELAHAVVRHTGKPTGRIRFTFVKTAKGLLRPAILELKAKLNL
jgi:Reverse transcriptase (RNA-dependent DNA polymerase)